MSRYDWESGTLKIPTAAWKPLRDSLVAAYNARQVELFKLATAIHEQLLAEKKAAPRGKFHAYDTFTRMYEYGGSTSRVARELNELEGVDEVRKAILKREEGKTGTAALKLQVPKKKDFPILAASKATSFSAGYEGSISLDAESKKVHWSTGDNNHAVERARDSHMGKAFFRALREVKWTRGSGGEFVGNDEYNRDSEDAGGGANYVTATFGPETKSKTSGRSFTRGGRSYAY